MDIDTKLQKMLISGNRLVATKGQAALSRLSAQTIRYDEFPEGIAGRDLQRKTRDRLEALRDKGAVQLIEPKLSSKRSSTDMVQVKLADIQALSSALGVQTHAEQADALVAEIKKLLPNMMAETKDILVQCHQAWRLGKSCYGLSIEYSPGTLYRFSVLDGVLSADFRGGDIRTVSSRVFLNMPKTLRNSAVSSDAMKQVTPSKVLEGHYVAITKILAQHRNLTPEEVSEELGVTEFAGNILIRGELEVVRQGCIQDLMMPPVAYLNTDSIPFVCLKEATPSARRPKSLVTIENKTSFERFAREVKDPNIVAIWVAGYPSHAVKALIQHLVMLMDLNLIWHWGDLDPDGLAIARKIQDCAGVHVIPVGWDLSNLDATTFEVDGYYEDPRNISTIQSCMKGEDAISILASAAKASNRRGEQEAVSPHEAIAHLL